MAQTESSELPELHGPELGADPVMVPPDILATDKDALDRASSIPGSQYGIRMSSNAALWALANQRTVFEKQIAHLMARDRRRSRSVTWAAFIVVSVGTIATGGAILSGQFRAAEQELAANTTAKMPKTADVPVDRPRPKANTALAVSSITEHRMAVTSPATHVVPPRPPEQSVPAPASPKKQKREKTVNASAWIAEPLQGEALRQALIVDRERTKELNDGELGRQITQQLD